MNRFLAAALFAIAFFLTAQAQERRFRIVQYNVENLFDTIPSPDKDDGDFTPSGKMEWNSRRYWAKLGRISRVIAASGGLTPPAIVTLCEIEGDSVVSDLTRKTRLWRLGYEYLITHSADTRGINIALLYQPALFRPLHKDTLRVIPGNRKIHVSRDVLHVAGELACGDTLDLIVCHFPSRRGGRKAARYRMEVAAATRAFADSIIHRRERPNLVVTGDFNALYPEKALTEELRVKLPEECPQEHELYLLSHAMQGDGEIKGTYKYQGEWNQLDHFAVNGRLLKNEKGQRLRTHPGEARIIDFPFLLSRNKGGNIYPLRTYLGDFYRGGYSDHLPIALDLIEIP